MKRDPLVEIEVDIHGDAAAALGQAGKRLRDAIEALRRMRDRRDVDAEAKKESMYAAGAALWAYIVQREAMGLTDHGLINDVYGVTSEVWQVMGARLP